MAPAFRMAAAEGRNLLGGKGANLAEMASIGLPVPPGFTITTEVCTYYYDHGKSYPEELKDEVDAALPSREGRRKDFGDADNPLLVSVRSGARAPMPGMMDTVLNLGLNDETVEGLATPRRRCALRLRQLPPLHPDVWRRRAGRRPRPVRGICSSSPRKTRASLDTELSAEDWQALVAEYKAIVEEELGKPFPQDPRSSCGAPSARCSAAG